MSAAPVSRSSALPEIPLPSRRAPERSEPEQAFTLPPEPVERARPRLDDDRAARESAETRDEPKSDDGARRTAAADAKSPGRTDEAGKDRKAASANEPSDKAKTEPAADEAAAKDATAADGKTAEIGAGDKPVKGKTAEESKTAPAAVLEGPPVVGEGKPEAQAVPVATQQPAPVPAVAAEFLALAALTVQGSEPAKPGGIPTPEGKPEGQVTAVSTVQTTAAPTAVNGLAVPAPTAPVKADGQASAGGEAAAASIKAGSTPQLVAAPGKVKVEATSGEAKQGDAKPADAQAISKDAGEAGKAMPTAIGGEIKPTEATPAGQPAQAGASDDKAAPATATQPASVPAIPQAILAAAPQSLTTPQTPLTELDAAAQATAHAQAEAAHKLVSGETGRATPLHVVPVEIGARALAGNKRFDIRLDPAELGRIDVSLEISDKGEVSAKLTVDRVETLHMLQRDARTLERAFEQAGLKPSDGGIDLSLRDPGDQAGARQQRQDEETPRGRRAWVQASDDTALVTEVASLPRNASRLGGVDLSI
jgi:flagellar hook-length control protein FliK